jgi:quercetin dioxygenase-like cupin family protein
LTRTTSITNSFERHASARDLVWYFGDLMTMLASGEETGGRFAIFELFITYNLEPPAHTHTREDEMIYVLDGKITLTIGGSELTAAAGSFVFLPRGIKHSWCVQGEQARLLMMFVPSGLEHFFASLSEPAGDKLEAQPTAMTKMLALADDYGLIFPRQKP